MKRLLCILLVLTMVISLTACSEDEQAVIDDVLPSSSARVLPVTDPAYADLGLMFSPIAKFVEYNHILNNTIDYTNVSAEDFWNIVALVVNSYEKLPDIASIDVANVVHMKWDRMLDFAKAFLYQSWYKHNLPSYRDSYSASADPGSGIIDLVPLNVDNFDSSLAYIEEAPSKASYSYVMFVDLKSRGDEPVVYHYEVFVADWQKYLKEEYKIDDEAEHILPYMVVGFAFIGSEELEVQINDEVQN